MAEINAENLSQKSDQALKRTAEITAILVGVFTILTILYNLVTAQLPPRFEFQFVGASSPGAPGYEVTAPLAAGGSQRAAMQLIINAGYNGSRVKGPVVVEVQTRTGRIIEVARWQEFQSSHHETRVVDLNPADLYRFSGLAKDAPSPNVGSSDPFAGRRGEVRINVRHNNRVLATTTLTVLNTPWAHSVYLSESAVQAGQPVTAYVNIHNGGEAASFQVQAEVFEIFPGSTTKLAPTLETGADGWTPNKTWKRSVLKTHAEVQGVIGSGETATAAIVLPAELLKARHIYVLETTAIKKLPYLDFPDGDWITSVDAWRARDHREFTVIVVLD